MRYLLACLLLGVVLGSVSLASGGYPYIPLPPTPSPYFPNPYLPPTPTPGPYNPYYPPYNPYYPPYNPYYPIPFNPYAPYFPHVPYFNY